MASTSPSSSPSAFSPSNIEAKLIPSNFIKQFTVKDIREEQREVMTVNEDTTVAEALKFLRANNILSMPVINRKYDKSSDEYFISILNMLDILTAVVFQPVFNTYDTDAKVETLDEKVFRETLRPAVFNSPVSALVGASQESQRLWMFKSTDPLDELTKAFASGVHHALVRMVGSDQVLFYSQTDFIRWLKKSHDKPELQAVLTRSIESLGLAKKKEMVIMSDQSTALSGFRRMFMHNELSALPVVDENGALVATLSAADLRGMSAEEFKNILLPVKEFLQIALKSYRGSVTCSPESTLVSVISKLLSSRVHRAWVVDKDNKPIGVVSYTDIIRKFSIYA